MHTTAQMVARARKTGVYIVFEDKEIVFLCKFQRLDDPHKVDRRIATPSKSRYYAQERGCKGIDPLTPTNHNKPIYWKRFTMAMRILFNFLPKDHVHQQTYSFFQKN